MLRGHADIYLTDVRTGEVEEHHDDNMVTNAIRDLVSMNPAGMRFSGSSYASNFPMLPLCPNALGGVILFPDTLTEDADKYYAPAANVPVGYASNSVDSTADPKRGGYNTNESGPTSNGYKLVWDFSTADANGIVKSVALTSSYGGEQYFGSNYGTSYNTVSYLRRVAQKSGEYGIDLQRYMSAFTDTKALGAKVDTTKTSFENGEPKSTTLYWYEWPLVEKRLPLTQIDVLGEPDSSTLTLSHCYLPSYLWRSSTTSSYTSVSNQGGSSFDGSTLYLFAFSGNSAGTVSIQYAKVQNGAVASEWALEYDCQLMGGAYCCVSNGYLYAVSHDGNSVMKLSMTNANDKTQIALPTGYMSITQLSFDRIINPYDDGIVILDYSLNNNWGSVMICDNVAMPGRAWSYCYDGSTNWDNPYKKGTRIGPYYVSYRYASGYSGAYELDLSVCTPYLATINNLAAPIVKTQDKTMKIVYTLTES